MKKRKQHRTQRRPAQRLTDGQVCVPRRVVVRCADSWLGVTGNTKSWFDRGEDPLMTDKMRRQLPKLFSTADVENPVVQVKYRAWRRWAWHAIEFDGEDIFFGFVWAGWPIWGYFRLRDLEAFRHLHCSVALVVDESFEPMPASEAIMDCRWEPGPISASPHTDLPCEHRCSPGTLDNIGLT